jgi:hypothetical protein
MVGKKSKDDQASYSILPSIAGVSPYKNATRSSALSKCIRAKNGEDVRGEQNLTMFMGDLLENTLLDHAVKTLKLVNADLEVDYAVKHPELPIEGSMDGIAFAGLDHIVKHDPANGVYVMGSDQAKMSGKVVLECKCTRDYPELEPPLWRGRMQMQGLMDAVDAKWGVLVVLYQSTDLRMFVYHRDEVMVKEIHKLVKDFDRRIREEDPFPPVNPVDALSYWDQAIENEVPLQLEEDAEDHIELINLADSALKKWTSVKEESTAKLMAMLKDNTLGECWSEKGSERVCYQVRWSMLNRKATEERIIPAKEAYSVRLKTLKIKEVIHES